MSPSKRPCVSEDILKGCERPAKRKSTFWSWGADSNMSRKQPTAPNVHWAKVLFRPRALSFSRICMRAPTWGMATPMLSCMNSVSSLMTCVLVMSTVARCTENWLRTEMPGCSDVPSSTSAERSVGLSADTGLKPLTPPRPSTVTFWSAMVTSNRVSLSKNDAWATVCANPTISTWPPSESNNEVRADGPSASKTLAVSFNMWALVQSTLPEGIAKGPMLASSSIPYESSEPFGNISRFRACMTCVKFS
mmetsp:Transcript_70889/g.184026  ORF Transcript_70889/g.184026 Transcript_70889/m.184026 type:complete len:249 (+) Transcript_70889:2175-2921(+)